MLQIHDFKEIPLVMDSASYIKQEIYNLLKKMEDLPERLKSCLEIGAENLILWNRNSKDESLGQILSRA